MGGAQAGRPDRWTGRRPLALTLYSLAWWLVLPLAALYLLWRSLRQPEYRRHWRERFGLALDPAFASSGAQPLIWIHAVSVGETRAAEPLLRALAHELPDARFLLTHMTPTGRAAGAGLFADLGERVRQRYLPYDAAWLVRGFLQRERPALGLVLETEIWPNLFTLGERAGVPVAVVNGRLSERSLQRGLKYRALMEPTVRALCAVVVQTREDAARAARLGRTDAVVAGNLKFDQAVDADAADRGRHWGRVARRSSGALVLAASTRAGEEALLLQAWLRATATADAQARPRLLIVPRHPQRFAEVAAAVERQLHGTGLRLVRRSDAVAFPAQAADVVLGDSMGEMAAWYAMADVAIIGGSILPFGSQNLIEACALACPVVLGPSTYNFEQAAAGALAAGAAVRVVDADEAIGQALAIARSAETRARMGAAGEAFAREHQGATQRTLEALRPWLPAAGAAVPAPESAHGG